MKNNQISYYLVIKYEVIYQTSFKLYYIFNIIKTDKFKEFLIKNKNLDYLYNLSNIKYLYK